MSKYYHYKYMVRLSIFCIAVGFIYWILGILFSKLDRFVYHLLTIIVIPSAIGAVTYYQLNYLNKTTILISCAIGSIIIRHLIVLFRVLMEIGNYDAVVNGFVAFLYIGPIEMSFSILGLHLSAKITQKLNKKRRGTGGQVGRP